MQLVDTQPSPELGAGRDFLEFAPVEYGRRHSRAKALMNHVGLDALVLAEPANVRYYTGLRSWFSTLPPVLPILAVLPGDLQKATVIDTVTERGSVDGATWIETPELYGPWDDPMEVTARALKRRGFDSGRLGLELGSGRLPHLSPSDLERLRGLLPNAEFIDASDILHASRAIKSRAEVGLIRRAVELIVLGFRAVYDSMRPGVTEQELTRVAAQAILAAGGTPDLNPQVFIFMAGADRYRLPLLPSTSRAVKAGELVSLDGGCTVQGYHSDFARAAVIGGCAPEVSEQFQATVDALEAAEREIGPGRQLGDAWAAAQRVLEERDLGGFTVNPRNIGHSIGLDHWELPTVARPDAEMGAVCARPGMVICVEPQVAGAHGDDSWSKGLFLVEDQVLVTETGVEILTSGLPRELYLSEG